MKQSPWLAYYDKGVPQSISVPDQPVFEFLEESARKYPLLPCTISNDHILSYQEMDALTDCLAGALARLGVDKGDRVGILLPNIPQFILAYFAILKAGAIVVAIDFRFTTSEMMLPILDSGIEVLFLATERVAEIKAIQRQTPIRTLVITNASPGEMSIPRGQKMKQRGTTDGLQGYEDQNLADLLARFTKEDRPAMDIRAEEPAIFQYTGGTTGAPKAAIATHYNLVANTLQFKSWLPMLKEGKEVMLAAIPLFHVYGMVLAMLLGISLGMPQVLVSNPRAVDALVETIRKYRPTVFPGVPLLYHSLVNHPAVKEGKDPLKSLKVCISGSAPLRREVKETFEGLTGGKILEGYGLSEAPTATHCNPQAGVNKSGSIGMPLPGVDARIVSMQDGETEPGIGEAGELIISSPQLMKGYYNKPEETALALRKLKDGKTWLFTGDVARMDEDGYFFILDRIKDLIKPGGEQVWPGEVEEVIASHPKVSEVSVAGVPDPVLGEKVIAWVVVKMGENITAAEIQEWCRSRLARYKIPRLVIMRTSLPKTTVGKVLRRELVRQFTEMEQKEPQG